MRLFSFWALRSPSSCGRGLKAEITGLDHQAFAGAAALIALLVFIVTSARAADLARILGSAALWAVLLVALTGAYAYRYDAADFFGRVAAELLPSEPRVGQGGEVIVNGRAVAAYGGGPGCVMALSASASGALQAGGRRD